MYYFDVIAAVTLLTGACCPFTGLAYEYAIRGRHVARGKKQINYNNYKKQKKKTLRGDTLCHCCGLKNCNVRHGK